MWTAVILSLVLGLEAQSQRCLDTDADGVCDNDDPDDDNDGYLDEEDCDPLNGDVAEYDCCGVCGGDGSQCGGCADCAGVPDGLAYVDNCGVCDDNPSNDCEQDCEGVWGGLSIWVDITMNTGACLHGGDIAVLQAFIDNSSASEITWCDPETDGTYCGSPNPSMDDVTSWTGATIDGEPTASNGNGTIEPLELGIQTWEDGRLISLMCGAYIYCQLSGEIPNNIHQLTEIETLRLELNYFTGFIPQEICGFEYVDYDDYLAFDLSYTPVCPPFPDCIPDSAVNYMDNESCDPVGDINGDGELNIVDIVLLVTVVFDSGYEPLADANGDGVINVVDVLGLVSLLISAGG